MMMLAAQVLPTTTPDPVAYARELLGDAAPPEGAPLHELVVALTALLAREGDATVDPRLDEHREHLTALRERAAAHLRKAEQIDEAVARLRQITAPSAMLAAAPAELGAASDFHRVVLSGVRDGVMTAEAAWVRNDNRLARTTLDALRAASVRLAHPMVEADVLRRRRAAIVADATTDPRVHEPTAELLEWGAFVCAPVVVRSTVIALLHADRGPQATVTEHHRDLVWSFAAGLAQAYEAASLRRMLRREHDEMRKLMSWLDVRSSELADASIRLEAPAATPLAATPLPRSSPGPGGSDTVVFDGILTRRELEVLRLIVEGASNRAIADELVISPGTAKFHVTRILGKLHVANRAQAVARYYALMGTRPRE